MADYKATKQNILRQSSFGNLMGVPLDGYGQRDGRIPIRPCIYVEAEGYPCDTLDDIIVWIPSSADSMKTGKRCEGDEVCRYDIGNDATVLVEVQFPMTMAQLLKAKQLATTGDEHTRVVFHSSSNGDGKVSVRELLVRAFKLGWEIGEQVDGHVPLSQRISKWFGNKSCWPRNSEHSRLLFKIDSSHPAGKPIPERRAGRQ